MISLTAQLLGDEAGFIVSAELVLIATILGLGMIVGLSEVANNVSQELEDIGSAFGSINQTYRFSGLVGHKGFLFGSGFRDDPDFCDAPYDLVGNGAEKEFGGGHHGGLGG